MIQFAQSGFVAAVAISVRSQISSALVLSDDWLKCKSDVAEREDSTRPIIEVLAEVVLANGACPEDSIPASAMGVLF